MAVANDSFRKPVPYLIFYCPFHISSAFLIGYCKKKWSPCKVIPLQSDPRSHCVLALVQLLNILPCPLQIFVQLEQCASYWGSRWILSRRQYAPNKQCVLNNDVCLITWFYSTCVVTIIAVANMNLCTSFTRLWGKPEWTPHYMLSWKKYMCICLYVLVYNSTPNQLMLGCACMWSAVDRSHCILG